ILTALLLKWIKDGRISIEEYKSKNIFSSAKSKITILKRMKGDSLEGRMFTILNQIAGDKGYLLDSNLSSWADRNYERIDDYEKLIMSQSKLKLRDDNLVERKVRR